MIDTDVFKSYIERTNKIYSNLVNQEVEFIEYCIYKHMPGVVARIVMRIYDTPLHKIGEIIVSRFGYEFQIITLPNTLGHHTLTTHMKMKFLRRGKVLEERDFRVTLEFASVTV